MTRWITYEEQLRRDAESAGAMSPDDRIRALFDMVDFVLRMLTDTGTIHERMRSYDEVEQEGHRRWTEWLRRFRA